LTRRDFGPGPHFLCIGAQKAGTTWLHANLSQHPDVWLPGFKEMHYFNGLVRLPQVAERVRRFLRRGRSGEIRVAPEVLDFTQRAMLAQPKDDAWYLSFFSFAQGRCCGDMTPAYSTLRRETVLRIRRLLPSCRILFVMRDPVERTWSQALMDLRRDRIDPRTVGLPELIRRFESWASIRRTSYTRTIAIWESVFPADQLQFLFYDRIATAPDEVLETVCRFLELAYDPAIFRRTKSRFYNRWEPVPMPAAARRYLADKYRIEIETLAARFGGPPQSWFERCEAVLAGAEPSMAAGEVGA